jgi:hypothetical protein
MGRTNTASEAIDVREAIEEVLIVGVSGERILGAT